MKRTLLYLTPLLVIWLAACTKSVPVTNIPAPTFSGTYGTQFIRLHQNMTSGKIDTTLATISITMDKSGAFSVAGDTSTVHAGSHGTYSLGVSDDLVFTDKTLPPTGTPVKYHLNGDYNYVVTGTSTISFQKNVGDSIIYRYDLTKTSN